MAEYKKVKYYFDQELAELLSGKISALFPSYQSKSFIQEVAFAVDELELKGRVAVIAAALRKFLPSEYKKALAILVQILGPENEKETGMFTEGYWLMPVAYFVEKYGCAHFNISVQAIYEITKRHTGEYAVRPFLEHYPEKMLSVMCGWAEDRNFHVRRLACEGMRPRLPWTKKLQAFIDDPAPLVPVLEQLKDDPSLYVRKSVANSVNDILKDNYVFGMRLLKRWSSCCATETAWVIKHALRKERKKENPEALELLGSINIKS